MDKIELELMDWKAVEKTAEDEIRVNLTAVALNETVRAEAKIQIVRLKGKTSEEERKENADKIEHSNSTQRNP